MEDLKIIDLFFQRSEEALDQLARKYSNYFYSIAYNILRNKEDVEECINDSYLRVWDAIPPNRPDYLQVFVGKIVRNTSINKLKYHKASKRNSGELDLVLSELEQIVSGGEDVESAMEKNLVEKAISDFLRDQSQENRTIFIRRYWYLKSISEIGDQLGISESKVKSSLFRTRNKLKIYLEKEGIFI